VRRFFRTAGLSSALTVMRTAIQGESQLQSMPNNTTIMISFAACFALTLSAYAAGGSTLAPSVRKLIDEAAGVLERIGAVTEHRNGLSVLYGRHLRQIVRRVAKGGLKEGMRMSTTSPSVPASQGTPVAMHAPPMDHQQHQQQQELQQQQYQQQQQILWPETLQFSTMSDDQIMQVLNQPVNDFDPSFGGLSWDDMNHFDWLHWPEFGS
jgi:apolipoprotein N-acyltransferase